jgi:hypothetical protein
MAGPIIVPIDQTKGITEYARAIEVNNAPSEQFKILTLMLRLCDEFPHHGLYHTNVTIQKTPNSSPCQCDPDIRRKPYHYQAQNRAKTSGK